MDYLPAVPGRAGGVHPPALGELAFREELAGDLLVFLRVSVGKSTMTATAILGSFLS
jgi:hypothetical protein